jgi:hypothetical protein
MSLQALSVTQTSRLTRSGRSNCRQAAVLIVAAHSLLTLAPTVSFRDQRQVARTFIDVVMGATRIIRSAFVPDRVKAQGRKTGNIA